jgi:hypothetical protein
MINLNLTPAHLHLALNHVPIIGLTVSCLPILIGILAQCRTTIAVGLLSTLLCAAAMPSIMESGHNAGVEFKHGSTLPPLDEAGKAALHIHSGLARKTTPIVYGSALIALMALIALTKFRHAATWLSATVLLGNTISILLAIWTADAGGKIRHLEFRPVATENTPTTIISVPSATPIPSITPVGIPQTDATPAISTPLLTNDPVAIPTATPSPVSSITPINL